MSLWLRNRFEAAPLAAGGALVLMADGRVIEAGESALVAARFCQRVAPEEDQILALIEATACAPAVAARAFAEACEQELIIDLEQLRAAAPSAAAGPPWFGVSWSELPDRLLLDCPADFLLRLQPEQRVLAVATAAPEALRLAPLSALRDADQLAPGLKLSREPAGAKGDWLERLHPQGLLLTADPDWRCAEPEALLLRSLPRQPWPGSPPASQASLRQALESLAELPDEALRELCLRQWLPLMREGRSEEDWPDWSEARLERARAELREAGLSLVDLSGS